jgi:hypothetical protein
MDKKTKQQKRSIPHTRAVQRDRSKRVNSAPTDEQIEQWMEEAVQPAVYTQMELYRQMGLRARVLTLVVMVAFVLNLLWRQLGSVREGTRVLREEGMLWVTPLEGVSSQAVLKRMGHLPATLFYNILLEVIPQMQAQAVARQRPLPPAVSWARQHFEHIWAADGSVLDNLLKKTGLLAEAEEAVLAGKIVTLVDVATQMPAAITYTEDSQSHDHSFWEWLMDQVKANVLLLLDKGWLDFDRFDQLTEQGVGLITPLKSNGAYQEVQVLSKTANVHDVIIRLGSRQRQCRHPMRLVSVLFKGKWYRYVTNVLDPMILPPEVIVALYGQRWRIEIVFTQMTKEGIFTVRVGGNYIADFDLAIVNNNSVNEQFNQLAALSKVKRIQGWLNFPAKVLDVLSQLEQVELLLGLRLQLAQLLGQAAVRLG